MTKLSTTRQEATTRNDEPKWKAPLSGSARSNYWGKDKQQFKELISFFERNKFKTALVSEY
jgi:hypothetical protein